MVKQARGCGKDQAGRLTNGVRMAYDAGKEGRYEPRGL